MRTTKRVLLVLAVVVGLLSPAISPASANIGPNTWDRSTIVVQTMKAGTSTEMTWQHERLSYYRNVAGSTLSIVEGSCQVNMPCIRVYWDFYGTQSWDGLTTEAYTNCLAAHAWCRYDGTNSAVTHTTVQFDRSQVDSFTATAFESLVCHEWGRALAELTAAAGQTCMNSGTYAYTGLLSTEASQVRAKYQGMPR